MKSVPLLTKIVAVLLVAPSADALRFGRTRARSDLKASAATENKPWTKDAFNNMRVPAALLSGSAFAAVNGAPLPGVADALWVGIAKRVYLTASVATFASSLISVLVATVALEKMSKTSIDEADLEFDYVACQSHFFFGVLGACTLVGLRAWISFTCPRFGNIAFGIMTSAFALMLHFLPLDIARIPLRYVQLLVGRLWFSPFLLIALGVGSYTAYLLLNGLYLGVFLDPSAPAWNLCPARPGK